MPISSYIYAIAAKVYRLGKGIRDAIDALVDRGVSFSRKELANTWPDIARREEILRKLSETPKGQYISLRKITGCTDKKYEPYALYRLSYIDEETGKTGTTLQTIGLGDVKKVEDIINITKQLGSGDMSRLNRFDESSTSTRSPLPTGHIITGAQLIYIDCM